ncbi:MAG: hypothetical protein ABI439_12570 [Rhodospirillales bacterium]
MSTEAPTANGPARIKINLKRGTLNEENLKFEHRRLDRPVFLNSVPKCGSHLLKNIVRMFVPLDQQYQAQFVQLHNMREHFGAFSDARNFMSYGHLMFNDMSAVATASTKHILLVRDPYDWVMARARFFVSEEFQGFELLKDGILSIDAILNMMIFGIAEKAPSIGTLFSYNAVAWLGVVHLVRYEELLTAVKELNTPEAESYFRELLGACGIDLPEDWRERVRIGSDPKQSGTARENLTGVEIEFPKKIPEMQKAMVDFAAPGLRSVLGYT